MSLIENMENINKPIRINKKAIFYGFLVDVGGSLLALVVLGAILGTRMALKGATPADIESLTENPLLFIVAFLIGLAFSVLGGFVTANVAKQSPIKHAFYLGVITWILLGISFLTGYLVDASFYGIIAIAYNVLAFILVIPAVVLGGYLASKKLK